MLTLALFLLNSTVALAAEIIVLSSQVSGSAMRELGPIFETATAWYTE
jgi:hypothetical protein